MSTEYKEKYQCPECESETIRFKFKVKNNDKNSAYANVIEEIQCATCFMDIPANVFVINKDSNIEENKTIWNSFYKPEHIRKAAQCSKCTLYYWDIEREL